MSQCKCTGVISDSNIQCKYIPYIITLFIVNISSKNNVQFFSGTAYYVSLHVSTVLTLQAYCLHTHITPHYIEKGTYLYADSPVVDEPLPAWAPPRPAGEAAALPAGEAAVLPAGAAPVF